MNPRIILASVMLVIAVCYLAWRWIGTGKGAHAAPRRYVLDDEPTAVIPRVPTEHAPPWDYLPAPVTEPVTIISGPPEPEPDAYWLAAGTIEGGQLRTVRVEVLPPPVEALLGHASTQDAVDAFAAGWHSVESLFSGFDVREVRALTDGAS